MPNQSRESYLPKFWERIVNRQVKETADGRRQTAEPATARSAAHFCCRLLSAVCRLTHPGRGAVATFHLSGEGAADIFHPHWLGATPLGNHPHWGHIQLNDAGDCEEAVVCQNNDETIEIHVHGGEQIASAIESLFERHGAIRKTWQEVFTDGTTQQQLARRLLPFAPTERTAQILLDQYNGAFDRELFAIEQLSDPEKQQQRRARLQELTELGNHLIEPYRVVLAGASNAGKSSLLNTILGFQRSLVHAIPGTTRDVVSGQTALEGFPVTFFDTAGFRETGDPLERQGIDRSLQSLTDADLVIWVIDLTVEEAQRPACPVNSNVLFCTNKIDIDGASLPRLETADGKQQTAANIAGIPVSALTGEGIEQLLTAVIRHLVPNPPQPGEAVPLAAEP